MQILSPSQRRAVDRLVDLLPHGSIFTLWAGSGLGKSTMLAELHDRLGGELLTLKSLVDGQDGRHPLAIEDGFYSLLMDTLKRNDVVLVDDLDELEGVLNSCNYTRSGWLDSVLKVVCTYATESGKKLIFTNIGRPPEPVNQRCHYAGVGQFEPDDYKSVCAVYMGEDAVKSIDFNKIHRFTPRLNGHQLKSAAQILKQQETQDTDAFIEYLLERGLASNVVLSEVEQVDLNDLKGVDHVLQALETHLVVPFEQAELARELDLRPKRGVLLYGPPGTGKTSVGRALAHRMKGKFFLIDGTCITGTSNFYSRVMRIFREAKENAPSVIFVDDSDVIWDRVSTRNPPYRFAIRVGHPK